MFYNGAKNDKLQVGDSAIFVNNHNDNNQYE